MGFRVDRVAVQLSVYIEFEGQHVIAFAYEPRADDPLVLVALAKNDELNTAAIAANPPTLGDLFIG
jgi:hypothetical protein